MVYQKYIKRSLDIIFATFLIILGFVPMVIFAVIIKATSSGPVFFKQERYGLNSKKFLMYKFRSMYSQAPILANQDFNDIDSYVTPIGDFMRKTSIDELPQLWNVLIGDMSFVGPRPLADTDINVITLRKENGADLVRPGMTGLAQVNGRNKLDDIQKAKFDGEYANHLNFKMECYVVFRTFFSVANREGINNSGK
ncbi:sugar transferase [Weissella confusa]